MRRTKIIATLGPASDNPKTIKQLIDSGVNVFRLNMSHGSQTEKRRTIKIIKAIRRKLKLPIAILLDLQGPRIRTGKLVNGPEVLIDGQAITIVKKQILGNAREISTTYPKLISDVKKGDRILIDNGDIELKVIEKQKDQIKCLIVDGGKLGEHKGINLPGVKISAPTITAKDKNDLAFAIKEDVDFVALSFVRSSKDVKNIKNIINKSKKKIQVIAKIEKPEALKEIDKIVTVSDVIMVARGDLGVELNAARVPVIQKEIVKLCNQYAKPVIVATQMMESMVHSLKPTRAESSDVANAVFDGADALMLSEEVSIGDYPVESVKMMAKIIAMSEEELYIDKPVDSEKSLMIHGMASAIGRAITCLSHDINPKLAIAFTYSGNTALIVSKYKDDVPIIGATSQEKTYYHMAIYFGVMPILINKSKNMDEQLKVLRKKLINQKLVKLGDLIVVASGILAGRAGNTNLIRLYQI